MRRLLILDDEPEILQCLTEYFADQFDSIECALNGIDALEKLKGPEYSLIISDFKMPKLDGLEFIKTLKERDIRTPVIWISGQADPASQTEAWRAGITEFHRKPFRFDELQHSVEVALALGHAESSVREKLILHPSAKTVKIELEHELWNYLSNAAKSAGFSLESFIIDKLVEDIPADTLQKIVKR